MHDMTQGKVRDHVVRMMSFVLAGMAVQTLYSLVDIYWVGRLGKEAVAAVTLSTNLMFVSLFTALCQLAPALLVRGFSNAPDVVAAGVDYLRTVSWGYVASGVVFACAGVSQGLGNTWPSLAASGLRAWRSWSR